MTNIKLEVGKAYFNNLGDIRTIVGKFPCAFFDFDPGPYVFMDDQEWTYTEDGIYDLVDSLDGYTKYDLVEGAQ